MDLTKHRNTLLLLCVTMLVHFIAISKASIFSTQPKSQIVQKDSTADIIFECRAGNELTNPTYSWTKDGQPLVLEGRFQLYTGDLYISEPDASTDYGTYMCIVDSDQGKAGSNLAELSFSYLEQAATETTTITSQNSMGVKMECGQMDYSPEYSVKFLWQNEETFGTITPNGKKGKFVSQKSGNMYFANPKESDSGEYRCQGISVSQINNLRKSTSGNIVSLALNGESQLHEPSLMVSPDEVTYAKLYGKAFIECFASGNPTPDITWTKDGGEMPAFAKLTDAKQLYFVDVTEEAEGTYTCNATNSLGSVVASGDLVLKYPPMWTDEIYSSPHDLASNVSWRCAAKAVPAASYEWWKNGEPLGYDEYNVAVLDGDGFSSLTITNLVEQNAGIYQCVASNELGKVVSSANLVVNSFQPVIDPPVPSVTSAALGHDATIFCTHSAAPAAEVRWTREVMEGAIGVIERSDKFSILSDASLIIHDVTYGDEGRYSCLLTNVLGSDQSSGNLRAYAQTEIRRGPEDIYIEAGKSTNLKCEATKDDALALTWIWTHDDETITGIMQSQYVVNGGTLNIQGITSEESGEYKCCAETSVLTPCATAKVFVTAAPDAPTGVNVLGSTATTQELTWEAPFDNNSPITSYTIDLKNSYSSEWRTAETDPETVVSTGCTVINLYPYNDYMFRVNATNDFGMSKSSADSTVASTMRGAPPKAPRRVKGGGGEVGELVVTWEPLSAEFYGSDTIEYEIAVQKLQDTPTRPILPLPLPEPNSNSTAVVVVEEEEEEEEDRKEEEQWKITTIVDANEKTHTFQVDPSEVYFPYNVKIRAVNNIDNGPWSRIRVVHTFEIAPDTAPEGLVLTSAEAYIARLMWNRQVSANGRIVGYELKITPKAGPDTEERFFRIEKNVPGHVVEGLLANSVYEASVAGYNGAGQGPWSTPLTFNTKKKPPSQPPKNVEVSIKNTIITADWQPIIYQAGEGLDEEPLRGYKIQYWHWNTSSRYAKTHTTTNTHYQFTVTNNSRFSLHVRGYSDGGDGPESQIFYLSTESTAGPGFIHCCGASALRFNSVIIFTVTLLWMFFVKLDL